MHDIVITLIQASAPIKKSSSSGLLCEHKKWFRYTSYPEREPLLSVARWIFYAHSFHPLHNEEHWWLSWLEYFYYHHSSRVEDSFILAIHLTIPLLFNSYFHVLINLQGLWILHDFYNFFVTCWLNKHAHVLVVYLISVNSSKDSRYLHFISPFEGHLRELAKCHDHKTNNMIRQRKSYSHKSKYNFHPPLVSAIAITRNDHIYLWA